MGGWQLVYDGWDPGEQPHREALCTLSNGWLGVRGAFAEARAGGAHYPGTYVAGGYDRIGTELRGRVIENEDLVNWPDPTLLDLRPEGGDWLDLDQMEILDFEQVLDLAVGELRRRVLFRDAQGRTTSLRAVRFVCMHHPHLMAERWEIVPKDWSGRLELRSGLDGSVENRGVPRYRGLRGRHLVSEGCGEDDAAPAGCRR